MSNVYAAVSFHGFTITEQIQTSPDGAAWTARSSPIDTYGGTCIAYGNGRFIALGLDSGDGITWIATRSDDDGVTWDAVTIPQPSDKYTAIAYGGGIWVGLGLLGETIYSTDDGDTWASGATLNANENGWDDVAYGQGIFVAVGSAEGNITSNTVVATSSDGNSWTAQTALNRWWQAVVYGDKWVAVSSGSPDLLGRTISSPDAVTWTGSAQPSSGWDGVGWDGVNYVGSDGAGTGNVMYSPSGAAPWTQVATGFGDSMFRIRYLGGQWIVCLDGDVDPNTIATSPTGISSWSLQTTPILEHLRDIAYSAAAPPPAGFRNLWDGMVDSFPGNCLA